MRRPDSTWRVIAARVAVAVARLEARDDRLVLGDEVLVALDAAAADHLHHQVDGELAVEAREQRVAREVDLRPRGRRRSRCPIPRARSPRPSPRVVAGARRSCSSSAVSTATSAAWSSSASRTSYPSTSACVVTGVTKYPRRAFTVSSPSETRRVSAWCTGLRETPSSAASSCRLSFVPGPVVAPEDLAPQRLVDLLVQVRARQQRLHGGGLT